MSGPSLLEPQYNPYEHDPDYLHWSKCALCDEPVDPDQETRKHGVIEHDYCAALLCAEGDCEGHDDDD